MAGEGCPICETENLGTWIFTHLNPPATVRSCEEHIVFNLITMLAIQLDMPAGVLYEVIETGIRPEPEQPVEPPQDKPAAKRGRKPRMAAADAPAAEVIGDAVEA